MKKIILLPILLVAVMLRAQAPFEGTVTLKVMNSYSQEYLNQMPYLYSGVDTMVVFIKGDNIHVCFKQKGLHKIYKDNQLIYYSENLKDGFSIVDRKQDLSGAIEELTTNETRTMLGKSCTVVKRNILLNISSTRLDYWLAENSWNISPKALERLHSDLSSHSLTDLGGKVCLKMSAQVYLTGATDEVMKYAKNSLSDKQREQIFGSSDKNVNELSMSQIAEVLSIRSEPVSEQLFQPATAIHIEPLAVAKSQTIAQQTNDVVREAMKSSLMSNPSFAKKVNKGKINLDEYVDQMMERNRQLMENSDNPQIIAARELMAKSNMDTQALGSTGEDAAYNKMYFEHEIDLQTRNKAWLKEHNEIVQEVVTPVAYDLDEEWDF